MTEQGKSETPLRAIRRFCGQCCGVGAGGGWGDVTGCTCGPDAQEPDYSCTLHPWRSGHRRPTGHNPLMREIRKHCVDCMGGSSEAVADCTSTDCPLHPYRFGRNPKMAGRVNDGQFNRRP